MKIPSLEGCPQMEACMDLQGATSMIAAAAYQAMCDGSPGSVVISGGQTAAAVMDRLSVKTLRVKGEMVPGIVVAEAVDVELPLLVLKPGSYAL